MAILGKLAVLLFAPASALQTHGPIADAAASRVNLAEVTATVNAEAWRSLGNYSALAGLKVRDPIPALKGCHGFDCVEKYVNFDDGAFTWGATDLPKLGNQNGHEHNLFHLTVSSQAWPIKNSGKNAWSHELTVCVPTALRNNSKQAGRAILFVEEALNPWAALEMAARTGAITVAISSVPNVVSFPSDGLPYEHEEFLKAWSWAKYARDTSHPEWPIEMPNVKAVVRVMDAIVAMSHEGGLLVGMPKVNRFIVTGDSKRGMAAWMAGAVDPRVEAVVPVLIGLDMHHTGLESMQNLGGITEAMLPYKMEGVYDLTDEQRERYQAIADPINYVHRLTMPKMAMFAGNDQFFPPDVMRAWWTRIPEPKSLYVYGSSMHQGYNEPGNRRNHFLDAADAFINGLILDKPTPKITWSISPKDGTMDIQQVSNDVPTSVTLWAARTWTTVRRDFRNALWKTNLGGVLKRRQKSGRLAWQAVPPKEEGGHWVAIYVAFEYPAPHPGGSPLRLTTEVSVFPNTRPFPDARSNESRWQQVIRPDQPLSE